MMKNQNARVKTVNLGGEIGVHLCDAGLGNGFSDTMIKE